MQYDRLARRALWWYVAGCFIRTVLPMTGLVEHSGHVEGSTGAERVSAFGQDPNYSAMLLSAALLISLGLNFGPRRVSNRAKLVGLGLAGFFALAIVNTGSRGGLIALVAGIGCFALARARNPMDRLRSTGIVAVGFMAITYFVMTSYVMRKRIETTASGEVKMAGREVLFPNLWNMFLEKPVNGWGPVNNYYEVVVRGTELVLRPEQVSKDPHNLFLELLTSTGLLGTVPFLVALALCFRAAWRARDGDYGVIPLSLMSVFLMANVSLNQVAHKPFWFFMAFALATQIRLGRSGTPGFSLPS
jgi:O-antigen ligase